MPHARGTPTRVLHLARAMARRGHEVHVVTYHLGEPYDAGDIHFHRIRNVPTYRKLSPGPSYQKLLVVDPLLSLKLGQVLRTHSINLIHAHHIEGLLVASLARKARGCPVIFDAHTLIESELPQYRVGLPRGAKQWVGRWLDQRLPRYAAHTIAVTDDIRNRLLALDAVKGDDISVVSSGVECEVFDRADPIPENREPDTIVYAGNLAPYQGINLLLKAFAELLHRRRQDVRLLIVSGSSFGPYEGLAGDLGIRNAIDVVHAGFDEVPRYLANADVAVNPRVNCPGIPQKLLNYMAAGIPVVSFAGSAKHIIHEERGWVVENGDTQGFARAIDRLLRDRPLARRLAGNAKQFVQAQFGWDRMAALTEAIYVKVTASAGVPTESGNGR
jgi:glycosyltransferase involved in cell wall biosynthesis